MDYFSEQIFENQVFSATDLAKGEYDECQFVNCDFTAADITEQVFMNCVFKACNLSNVFLTRTAFRAVHFSDCKLLGLHFEYCNDFLFEVTFTRCNLNYASFYTRKLKYTYLKQCSLHEVDFSECDLTEAVFDECDLSGAIFDQTNLERCDFRNAQHFIIHPEKNRINQAKFSLQGLPGLLTQYPIHIDDFTQ